MKTKLYIAALLFVISGCWQFENDVPSLRPPIYGDNAQDKAKKELPFETKYDGGSPVVTIVLNGESLSGVVWDTGATMTQISQLEFVKLIKSGKIDQKADFVGYMPFTIADGSVVNEPVYNIKEVSLNCKNGQVLTCYNIEVCVTENLFADMLLGQNVMQKLPKCSVNTLKQVIEFE